MKGLAKLADGPGNLGLVERPERVPQADQVLIHVRGAGICGTDLHIEADEYPSVPPVTLGHEVSGIVAEVGSDVDPDWIHARVVCETFYSTCGRCPWCAAGRPNLCPSRRSIGTHVDGGFAPRLLVPARNLHRIPTWLAFEAAVLAEPLACVCHCMLDPMSVQPGDRVAIVGPGPIGMLAAQVASALGGEVMIAGLPSDEARLEVARGLGFRAVASELDNEGFDIAVDASGTATGIASCVRALRRGGLQIQIGIPADAIPIPIDLLLVKELQVRTGFASTPRSWLRAMAMIQSGDVRLEPLISGVTPLDDWQRAFDDLRACRGLKFVLDPSEQGLSRAPSHYLKLVDHRRRSTE